MQNISAFKLHGMKYDAEKFVDHMGLCSSAEFVAFHTLDPKFRFRRSSPMTRDRMTHSGAGKLLHMLGKAQEEILLSQPCGSECFRIAGSSWLRLGLGFRCFIRRRNAKTVSTIILIFLTRRDVILAVHKKTLVFVLTRGSVKCIRLA
jgi:hypothetical protein